MTFSADDHRYMARALDLARQALAARDYPKAIEFLNLVVEGWPDDATAKDLLNQARKASTQKPDYDLQESTKLDHAQSLVGARPPRT